MEAQDVRDDEYRLFDCCGAQFKLLAEADDARVGVGAKAAGRDDFDAVQSAAMRFLASLPIDRQPRLSQQDLAHGDDICAALDAFAM
ncbi:MAG TPA: hypothetical protein VGK17_18480 [Propionicimonas sp.]